MNNRDQGLLFESMFKDRAQINGMLAEKNHLTARYLPGGRVKVVKSELDYRLINQSGRIGYFDCKSFIGDSFTYSQIDPDQLDRALKYEYWNIPSGFIVWLRSINKVVWFKGTVIQRKGARASFGPEDGVLLGTIENFDLKRLLS